MRRRIALLVVALLGSAAAGISSALSEVADDPAGTTVNVVSHDTSRTWVQTETRHIDLSDFSRREARTQILERPVGKQPRSRGPIVVRKEGCVRDRDARTHLQVKFCTFDAYAKASRRPNATNWYLISWNQMAVRAIGGWCLTRLRGGQRVLTSKILSSTPEGRVLAGAHPAAVRLHDGSGNGLGRMWVRKVLLRGGELRGRVKRLPEGDKASWQWRGSLHGKTLRIVTAKAVSVPVPEDGFITSRERTSFRTASCPHR